MRYGWQIFLVGIILFSASCRSAKNLPKSSARIELDSLALLHAQETKNLKMKLRNPADTLTFYVNVITEVNCPELVRENQKLHKKQRFWKTFAGVVFVLATGRYIYTLSD